jgi:hypothetical protein
LILVLFLSTIFEVIQMGQMWQEWKESFEPTTILLGT